MSDFSSPTGINWAGAHYGTVRFGEDSQKVVVFYIRSVENPARSRTEGVRVFENVAYVRIHEPGERLNIVDRPVKDEDKDRFPTQWSRFVNNKSQIPDGTLVDLLFPNNPAVADNLKTHGVHTVQQLAKLSANAVDTIGMGAQEWVNMANAYLKNASDGSAFIKLQSELSDLKRTIKIKDDQIAKLIKQVDTLVFQTRNPDLNTRNPPFIPGYDVQSERLNSNHVTRDLSKITPKVKSKNKAPPMDELDQSELLTRAIGGIDDKT